MEEVLASAFGDVGSVCCVVACVGFSNVDFGGSVGSVDSGGFCGCADSCGCACSFCGCVCSYVDFCVYGVACDFVDSCVGFACAGPSVDCR